MKTIQSRPLIALVVVLACSGLTAAQTRPTSTSRQTIAFTTNEGTTLAFDLSPDGRSIVFDLLGQLWILPAVGGAAQPLTDAVRDTAEDLDPTLSPDGRNVVFRAERNGRVGLWLLDLASRNIKQLTQLASPEGYEGGANWSPDSHTIAFTRVAEDASGKVHARIRLIEIATGSERDLGLEWTEKSEMRDPAWTPDGRRIVFVAASPASLRGGRLWIVEASGGKAAPLSAD